MKPRTPILGAAFLALLSLGLTSLASARELPEPETVLANSPRGIRFDGACEPGKRITLAAVGDVLLHRILQLQIFAAPERFTGAWNRVEDLLRRTDLTYANLEGPTARGVNKAEQDAPDPGFIFDNDVYSGLPDLNYHPSLLQHLLQLGVDIVSTGNNHALDRGTLGLERTIEALREAGLPFAGTRARSDTDPLSNSWHVVTETQGIRIAWISCTYQNVRNPDPLHLVLQCYNDEDLIDSMIRDIRRQRTADAIIVLPHWGKQFVHLPQKRQIRVAHRFLEAGALAVLGAHPHVIQPWERVVTRDGRETFVIYSLGNFVSGHRELPKRATVVLNLGLTKKPNGRVILNGVRYTPLVMTHDPDAMRVQAIDRHPLRDQPGEVSDARDLLLSILGDRNLAPADEPLRMTPECGD